MVHQRKYPTLETCEVLTQISHNKRRIYDETLNFREHEKLESAVDDDQRIAFLDLFIWEDFQLAREEQALVERLLEKYHRVFAPTDLI